MIINNVAVLFKVNPRRVKIKYYEKYVGDRTPFMISVIIRGLTKPYEDTLTAEEKVRLCTIRKFSKCEYFNIERKMLGITLFSIRIE